VRRNYRLCSAFERMQRFRAVSLQNLKLSSSPGSNFWFARSTDGEGRSLRWGRNPVCIFNHWSHSILGAWSDGVAQHFRHDPGAFVMASGRSRPWTTRPTEQTEQRRPVLATEGTRLCLT